MIRRALWPLLGLLCAVALVSGLAVRSMIRSVPRLFQRNAELKAQGYYMGEFEFKMVASQYLLSEGRYLEAYRTLRRIGAELQDPQGLPRMPERATPEEQMDFLLSRQDPVTGAFMDRRYPDFSYFAPTCNVVEALSQLGRETGRPFRLRYPLRFLDRIRTPGQLRSYLDSLLYLDALSAKLPGPGPYGPGVSELAAFRTLEEAGACRFSPEWEEELRRWFYETQDPATGFWGARIGRPGKWRQKADISSTFHILKLVLDERGGNQSDRFPLRYGGALARGIMASLETAMPEDAAGQHDWGLQQNQGAKLLAKYLWPHLSEPDRAQVRALFRRMLDRTFRLYRPVEGGFAYYSSGAGADLDGTGLALGLCETVGLLPGTWQRERLWGSGTEASLAPVQVVLPRWEDAVLPPAGEVQSFRLYRGRLPSRSVWDDQDLVLIVQPAGAQGCDVQDLRQGLARFLGPGSPAFGNWTSKQSLRDLPLGLERGIRAVPVSRGTFDLAQAAREHPAQRYYLVGYDLAQVPVSCQVFVLR